MPSILASIDRILMSGSLAAFVVIGIYCLFDHFRQAGPGITTIANDLLVPASQLF